tara:strand:+ start:404 stop:544 length:141 start_codon:yes stop_codon:yes gene_type:complete
MKNFTGYKYWEQNNPAYREACRIQAYKELIELKGQYDYFIKQTVNK